MAYISNLPAIMSTEANNLLKSDRILKLPPMISPNAVPLFVIQANVVQNVVSMSRFSKENTREPKTNTRKYSIRNTVMEDTLDALTGFP